MTREEAIELLTSILHTDGAYMDYLDSEDVEAIKFLANDERPQSQENKKCPNCGSDLYEYCFMCCYEGEKVIGNDGLVSL